MAAHLGRHAGRGVPPPARGRASGASDVQRDTGDHHRRTPRGDWPWLVQAGVTRAGWYSYDILDNLGRTSARHVIPELQHLAVGDVVPMSPDGKHGIRVHSLDRPHSMIWGKPGETTWTWQLDGQLDGSTRLITRVRSRYKWLSPSIAASAMLEFCDIWMMRKMLLNLRVRAEGASLIDGV